MWCLIPNIQNNLKKITWKKIEEYNYFELWLESRDVGQALDCSDHVTDWPMPRDHRSLVGPMIAPIISLISSAASMLRPAGGDHLLFNMLVKVRSPQ